MATTARIAAGMPTMAESRATRFVMAFILYVAQGLPLGLFYFALPAWLSANGASTAAIGFVATLVALPWSLKFVNGFLIDRYAYLPMGRRRAWLIGAQSLIIAGLLVLALIAPGPGDIVVIALAAFAIQTATTFQDVAIDSMAVDLVPDAERGRVNGIMFGGQSIGMALGTLMAGTLLADFGPTAAFAAIAAGVAAILAAAVAICERGGERRLPWSVGAASPENLALQVESWRALVSGVFRAMRARASVRLGSIEFCAGILFGVAPALGAVMTTRLLGWDEARFAQLSSTASLVAGLFGLAIGGWLVDRLGARRVSLGVFAFAIALMTVMALSRDGWTTPSVLVAFVVAAYLTDVMQRVSVIPMVMRVCDARVAATQFTVFMALANLGTSVASAQLGWLEAAGGYGAIMLFAAAGNAIGFAILWLSRVGRE